MSGENSTRSENSINILPDVEPESGDKENEDEECRIPCSLIVRNVPIEVFQEESVKSEFTEYITQYATPKNTIFLKSFRRVRFDFSSATEAYYVRTRLSMFEFHGEILHVYFIQPETITQSDRATVTNHRPSATSLGSHLSNTSGDESDYSEMQAPLNNNCQTQVGSSQTEIPSRQTEIVEPEKLYPPQPERVWLISPPSSPPLHWQQIRETKPKPGIEMEILSKLAELKPGDTVELIPPQPKLNAPQICVHVCDEDDSNNNKPVPKCPKGKIIQTRRPPIR